MKKCIVLLVLLAIMSAMSGCVTNSELYNTAKEPHPLEEISKGKYFEVEDVVKDGRYYDRTVIMINFAWKNDKGEVVFQALPLDKVKFKAIEGEQRPVIQFFLKERNNYLDYALVTCNQKEWPEIN